MTYKRSIKSLLRLVLLVMIAATLTFCSTSPEDRQYDAVVVATGDDEAMCKRSDLDESMVTQEGVLVTQDVCNVQAAVNENPGARILLKGEFHFAEYGEDGFVVKGTDGTVFITNDIEIAGEKNGEEFLTKIKGGYNTFSIGYGPVVWTHGFSRDEEFSKKKLAVPVKATIQDIAFENPLYSAIRVWATSGATIAGNKIIDGRSRVWDEYGFGFPILVFPAGGMNSEFPHLLSGEITVKENYIDGRYRTTEAGDPWGANSNGNLIRGLPGGIVFGQSEADITIEANEIHNSDGGISVNGNDGRATITNNLVSNPSPNSEIYSGYLIGIDYCGDCWYDAYETARAIIRGNEIRLGGRYDSGNQWTIGVWVDWLKNDPVISGNQITMLPGAFAGMVIEAVSNAEVTGNVMNGESQYGFFLGYMQEPSAKPHDGNTLFENDLGYLTAEFAPCYLGEGATNDTLYVVIRDEVVDESGNDTNTIISE